MAVDSVDRRSSAGAGKQFEVFGLETAKFLRPMAVAVRCTSSLLQVSTSCDLNDQPAELSEIRGC